MKHTPKIILFLDTSRGFNLGIASGVARYSMLNGPWTFYRQPHRYLTQQWQFDLKELRAWNPDGIICSIAQTKELRHLGVPMIATDPDSYSGLIPSIVSENWEAGRLAAQHLLDQGHRHFAFCGYSAVGWSQDRCRGFCDTVEKTGCEVDVYQSTSERYTAWAKEEPHIHAWLNSLPKPTGMFCANDDRAASILESCHTLEYGVPEDISVLGMDDDTYICELQNPPLSSVRIAAEQAGYHAAALLNQMIRGEAEMSGQRIDAHVTGITARQSTNVLMVQNTEVRKALRFIRENTNRAIQVTDVAAATSLSQRTLNDHFHAELDCSIVTQLTRARIDHITRLLTDTEMQIQEIAAAVGYDDDRHFSRYFKRATGLTPQAYRRKISPP